MYEIFDDWWVRRRLSRFYITWFIDLLFASNGEKQIVLSYFFMFFCLPILSIPVQCVISLLIFEFIMQVLCSACHSSSLDTGCVLFFVAYFDFFFYFLKDEGNVHICYIFGLSLKYVFLSLCISPILKLKRKSAKKDKTLSNNFVMLETEIKFCFRNGIK